MAFYGRVALSISIASTRKEDTSKMHYDMIWYLGQSGDLGDPAVFGIEAGNRTPRARMLTWEGWLSRPIPHHSMGLFLDPHARDKWSRLLLWRTAFVLESGCFVSLPFSFIPRIHLAARAGTKALSRFEIPPDIYVFIIYGCTATLTLICCRWRRWVVCIVVYSSYDIFKRIIIDNFEASKNNKWAFILCCTARRRFIKSRYVWEEWINTIWSGAFVWDFMRWGILPSRVHLAQKHLMSSKTALFKCTSNDILYIHIYILFFMFTLLVRIYIFSSGLLRNLVMSTTNS